MKIGVIFVAWQTEGYIEPSLQPWIEAKQSRFGNNDFIICAVSTPFEGFPREEKRDGTQSLLAAKLDAGLIDNFLLGNTPIKETEARGNALRWLKEQGVTEVVQVDSDEFYTTQQIVDIFAFVESQPLISWFRLCLKNFVFDDKTYLIDPFTPPRIHRVHVGGYRAHSFSQDNDIAYGGKITRDIIGQENFASMVIPKETVWVKHLTWLNDSRSRSKVKYQQARGWNCSFAWDLDKGLIFNEAYYKAIGQPLPEIARDET